MVYYAYYWLTLMSQNDLQNMQWRDVQKKLLEVQKDHLMCIHKPDLTELGSVSSLCLSLLFTILIPFIGVSAQFKHPPFLKGEQTSSLTVLNYNSYYLANNCMLKVNSRKTKISCEICSKLPIRFETIEVALVSLLLFLNLFYTFFQCFYC